MLKLSFYLAFLTASCQLLSAELKPFTSDGCSVFPDGTLVQQQLWLDCCTAHDLAYWQGGSEQDRERADLELKACVSKLGEPDVASLMLLGVRIGGTPYLPTSFRWGYGWPYPRAYRPLSTAELEQVQARIAEQQLRESTLPKQLEK
ncbi:hypothetical protein [Pseudoalteromonas 'SMAR']|uniref:hypothetical protein n=1 Tax=Pseudoalteromonas 'SMAR' TaxID=3416908 RepID=UPI003AF22AA5